MAAKKRKPSKKTTRQQRTASKTVATPAIHSIQRIVELLKPYELSSTNRFLTYAGMLSDESVWSALESRISAIEVAQSRSKLSFDKNSERSAWLKDFLDYNLSTMKKSLRQVGRDSAEFVYNGVALFEMVSKVEKEYGDYKGLFVLDDLVYIDPLSLDKVKPLVTKDGGRNIEVWRQLVSAFTDTNGQVEKTKKAIAGAIEIDNRKVARVSYSASSDRPLGTSCLDACYQYVREKQLIEEYLLMGIQRDMAGLPCLKVPLDLFEKAQDPSSDAYKTMQQLTEQMTNLHSSDQSFMILPADTFADNGSGALQYDVAFKGVEGNNKNFNLVEIIEQKKKSIYNVLGASHLIAGENGSGGSYNLYEGKASASSYYAQRDNILVAEMYNDVIIPMILKLNGFKEKISDIPVYVPGPITPLSAEESGKFVQRVASVGMMPLVPETVNHFLEITGTTYRVDEDLSTEELRKIMSNFDSNAGEGMGTSGTGDSQQGGLGSSVNSDNAA